MNKSKKQLLCKIYDGLFQYKKVRVKSKLFSVASENQVIRIECSFTSTFCTRSTIRAQHFLNDISSLLFKIFYHYLKVLQKVFEFPRVTVEEFKINSNWFSC